MPGTKTPSVSARAIVAHEPINGQPNWKLENVTLRELNPTELVVRMVSTGLCHTDIVFSTWPKEAIPYPKVLGHEGAGVVQEIGSDVKNAKVGDSVLLSFQSCSYCKDCKDGHPSYCQQFSPLNYGGEQEVFEIENGSKSAGTFFGQSSFASHTIVKESSITNVSSVVKDEKELKLFSPFGCGFQTGVGTVDKLTSAGKDDSIVIMGLGGVGLAAIMAAKIKGCKTIIGVDRSQERLDMASSFGATHIINTTNLELNLVEEVKSRTDGNGSSITIDTTGHMGVIGNGMDFTANRGQMIILGVPPVEASLGVHLISFMQTGKSLRGSIEGDVTPSEYIPKMIQWYRDGKLPVDKLVKFYPVKDFESALADMKSTATVKPVLVW
ncbi:NAD(P)-binding protein [Lophium mytilinum]|uniref:NAD(P)-binding protein n=1 Tax=Lophium mytilinum TaxID=390894 RepID=A0A6A6RAU2_9PEZI|nr:NAD(P)-binding protein [Lophium mytilinum]